MDAKLKSFLIYFISLIMLLLFILIIIIFSIDCGTGICDGPGLAILISEGILALAIIYSAVYWFWIRKLLRGKLK